MTYSLNDTIAAIATAPGEAGIGIVRISGMQALPILKRVFRPAANKNKTWPPESHRMLYGKLVNPAREPLDEVMTVWFQKPRSYTREDVVELHSHGGSVAVRQALGLVLQAGARLAEPGEMTLRAFLNGRIDLAQAEAVLDVVRARTEAGLHAAMEQLGGALSQEIRVMRMTLIDVLAHLTATIDFPEDDVPPQDISPELREVLAQLDRLLQNADRGILLRDGLRVAIVGRPNVGKSSLLNRLLRHERAIVTNIPGTTRDLVEESLNLRGIPIVLTDTAGIRETEDIVEAIGVERSRSALQQADLILFVLDASQPLTKEDHALASMVMVTGQPVLLVQNKQDLLTQAAETRPQATVEPHNGPERIEDIERIEGLEGLIDGGVGQNRGLEGALEGVVEESVAVHNQGPVSPILANAPHLHISALEGTGIEQLEAQMWQMVMGGQASASDATLITNPRHKQAIQQARDHMADALDSAILGMPADFLTIDLHAAVNALGEITGETATEDLLDAIFSRFCIGK
ncbi:MAG: tRNA uridine-5-carboxymethylaminomethyl(34) synthesis GTPase MnmE [Ardenticatenaceae bacterium]